MSKEELFKKYQEIVLKTNGGIDDYVVALCQTSDLIKDYAEEKDQQITDLQKQLAITEKALELAVNYMQSYCPYLATKKKDGNVIFYIDKTDCDSNCSNCIKTHYKQRAKEMLENE